VCATSERTASSARIVCAQHVRDERARRVEREHVRERRVRDARARHERVSERVSERRRGAR